MEERDNKRQDSCGLLDKSDKPMIEVVRIAKENGMKLEGRTHEVVFIREGRIRLIPRDLPEFEGTKGQILFLPAAGHYSLYTPSGTTLVVFRIDETTGLCGSFSMEKLYKTQTGATNSHIPKTPGFGVLEIHTRIWNFLDEITERLADGIKSDIYFDLKIREFFFLLKAYYTTGEIAGFLYLILSPDTAFSEYVRLYRHKFRNVEEMADSMHMTPRQFSAKFKKAFNGTPYKWMKQARAKLIRQQLINTDKPVKLVALENGFSDMAQFTKFCKKELGKTPTQLKGDNSSSQEGIGNKNDIFDKA